MWLLSTDIDFSSILRNIQFDYEQISMLDILKESPEKINIEEDINRKIINLIRDIINNDIDSNKYLELIRDLLKI